MKRALLHVWERIKAAWHVLTARRVMCVRITRRRGDATDFNNYWFGDWEPWELDAAGGTTAQCRVEELAEEAVKEVLNA